MASPLAVLSEAAHVYEQMEQLKMAEQVSGLNFEFFFWYWSLVKEITSFIKIKWSL